MSLPVALSLRSGKGGPSRTPAIPKIPGDVKFIAVKWSQNVVNLEILHEKNWYLTQLTEIFWKKWLAFIDLKEMYCNNYIVLIDKYRKQLCQFSGKGSMNTAAKCKTGHGKALFPGKRVQQQEIYHIACLKQNVG